MNWQFYLFLSLFCVFLESIFSMFEMATVSLNRIKLFYRSAKNIKKAKLLEFFLNRPAYLFGTTLICVNTVMQIGSEAARRFYLSLSLPVDFAPVTQILIVLIFAEISPLFAARRYSAHVADLFVYFVYAVSKVLTPFIWFIETISKSINKLFKSSQKDFFINKEELQKALLEPSSRSLVFENQNLDNVVANIFSLKSKKAKEIMMPLKMVSIIPSSYTKDQLKDLLKEKFFPYIPIYHTSINNIIAIAYPRDLLKESKVSTLIDVSSPPWFVLEDSFVMDILKQFRTNKQNIAVVLDKDGKSSGFITLDQIEDEIFGSYQLEVKKIKEEKQIVIEKTLSGDMTILEFNKKFNAHLKYKNSKTLSELVIALLEHHPSQGESVRFDRYEFIVTEPTILGIEKVKVRSIL